jgi:hypothetical protein
VKYTISVNYSSSWTETHDIEIPDGLTAIAFDEWIDLWVENARPDGPDPDQIECDEASVPDYTPIPPDLTMQPVPDAAWIVGKHRWAADGHVLVREGSPMPSEMGTQGGLGRTVLPWRSDLDVEQVKTLIGKGAPTLPTHPGIFHRRFAPVFAGASVVGAGPLEPAYVYRGGTLVAVVMPMQKGAADSIRVSS